MIKERQTNNGKRYNVRLRDLDGKEYARTFVTQRAARDFQNAERTDRARGLWVEPRKAETVLAAWADH